MTHFVFKGVALSKKNLENNILIFVNLYTNRRKYILILKLFVVYSGLKKSKKPL
jgi:hypothetical protein